MWRQTTFSLRLGPSHTPLRVNFSAALYTPSVHSLPVPANISLYTISMESSTYPREEMDSTVCHCHQYKLTSLRLYARSTTLASTEPKLNAPSACTTAHISSNQALRTKTIHPSVETNLLTTTIGPSHTPRVDSSALYTPSVHTLPVPANISLHNKYGILNIPK